MDIRNSFLKLPLILSVISASNTFAAKCQGPDGNWYSYGDPLCDSRVIKAPPPSPKEIIVPDIPEGKVSSYALSPYTVEKGYPKIVAKYGSRLPEIEAFRKMAAKAALDSGKCDYVEMSELSDSKSTIDHLQFWVDCRNKERIYIDESQLKNGARAMTQSEKSWTQDAALAACRRAIKERALIPGEVDIHGVLGTSFYKAPLTHNVVLNMDFDAKNAMGVELPYAAICHFEPGEVGTIEIKPR